MDTSIFANIRMVSVDRVLPFEASPDSESDARGCCATGVLRNPFPVIRFDQEYLLLDETEAFGAARNAGIPHVPVHTCPPDAARSVSRQLAVSGFKPDDLRRLAEQHPDQIVLTAESAECPADCLPLLIEFADRTRQAVLLRHSTRVGCPAPIDFLFRAITSKGRYWPTFGTIASPETPFRMTAADARLTLPDFSVDTLWSAATSGRLFPPGLIDVRLIGRVVGVDLPLAVLESEMPVEEKETFLRDLILYRQQTCRTAQLDGPVYILNR